MIALPAPVRRDPAPLVTRRIHAPRVLDAAHATRVTPSGVEGQPHPTPSGTLEEALAKVKTPEDDELAQQQAAFDRLMQARAEQLREANAIRDLGMEQMKKENAYMEAFIKMI
jgi:hypothetical protein